MEHDKAQRLERLTSQLAETLMTAAFCVEEIRSALCAETGYVGDDRVRRGSSGKRHAPKPRPLLSDSTLSVCWKGRSLYLGHTVRFRLLDRLARRPNQYVTHLDLLHDVWDDEELTTDTIRSTVRHLRRRLRDGGMGGLAKAIRGHNGRYILEL